MKTNTQRTPYWLNVIKKFANKPDLHALEIGSFEGESTVSMLEHVLTHPTAQITCIDPFLYLPKEQLFDENTSSFKQKIIKIKGHSQEKLRKLPLNYYDFIYINGSHIASDVLEDAILSFRLLKDNGILIFDNCRQKKAIDAFLTIYSNRIQLLQKNYRIVLQKLGPLGVTKIPKITSRMA